MYRIVAVILIIIVATLAPAAQAAEKTVGLRMIIVRDRSTARTIHQQLRQGASFSALARTKSIGPQRQQWGFSGVVRLDEVQDELRPVLRKLKPGQISDVLALGRRYAIVKRISSQMPQLYDTAAAALRDGKIAPAIKALRSALRLEQDNVQTHMMLSYAHGKAKAYKEAIRHLDKAQNYAPNLAQLVMLRAALYTEAAVAQPQRSYAQKALKAYQQALRLDEHLAPAISFGMGKVYLLALKQPKNAIGHLEKAAAGAPELPEIHQLLIQAYYDTKRYKQAWKHLRVAQGHGFDFPKLRDALYQVTRKSR